MTFQDPIPNNDIEESIKNAEIKIKQIFQMMAQFGANTSEKDLIDNLIEKMKLKEITPEKAIDTANQILSDKNGFLTQYR